MAAIKIFENKRNIENRKSHIDSSIRFVSEILDIYSDNGVDVSDEEMNALISSNFHENAIFEIVTDRTKDIKNTRLRAETKENTLIDFELFYRVYNPSFFTLSPNVQVVKGKAKVKAGTFEEIERSESVYLTDDKAIELYHKHNKLIDEINALCAEIKAHTGRDINPSYLVHFDHAGNAYRPYTFVGYDPAPKVEEYKNFLFDNKN